MPLFFLAQKLLRHRLRQLHAIQFQSYEIKNPYCSFSLYSAARVLALVVQIGGADTKEARSDLDVLIGSLTAFSEYVPLAQTFNMQLMADMTGFSSLAD